MWHICTQIRNIEALPPDGIIYIFLMQNNLGFFFFLSFEILSETWYFSPERLDKPRNSSFIIKLFAYDVSSIRRRPLNNLYYDNAWSVLFRLLEVHTPVIS